MKIKISKSLIFLSLSSLAACNSASKQETRDYEFPPSLEEVRDARVGSLSGDKDGVVLYDKNKSTN